MKKFFSYIKLPNIICIIILLLFIIMANGYGLLEKKLNVSGETIIDIDEVINPEVGFKKTEQLGDYIFFYDIIIYNNSNNDYLSWQIKINDAKYISYPYSIDAKRTDGPWIINNSNWDERIEAGGKVNVTIIFEVSNELSGTELIEEYVQDFLKKSIEITCSTKREDDNGKEVIKEGNANLTLKDAEMQIKNYSMQKDVNYSTSNPDEKMYVLTLNNDTDSDFLAIRGNIYLGTENKMLEVSPSAITCSNINDTTFILPSWIQVAKGSSLTLYFMINTKNDNFIPNIVLAATI